MTVTHLTASVFIFRSFTDGWRLGLISHPMLGGWTIPGGHVEHGETVVLAALREVSEETGLVASLVAPAMYTEFDPWWVELEEVPADSHHPEPHLHRDHVFVGLGELPAHPVRPEHDLVWYSEADLSALTPVDLTHVRAARLFPLLGGDLFLSAARLPNDDARQP